MDVPFKLLKSNVLTKRSGNILSQTIPNKPERAQPNINGFFSANTKTKVDSPSITARKPPSTASHVIPDTPQDKPSSGNSRGDLSASFVFPEDDWDDFNFNFETPVKGKSSPVTSGSTDKKSSKKDNVLKKTIHNDADCSSITTANKPGCTTEPYITETSPEREETNSPDLWGPEDSPVRMPRRRPKTQRTPVLSDDEEESVAVVKPFEEVEGNYYHISCCTVYTVGQAAL